MSLPGCGTNHLLGISTWPTGSLTRVFEHAPKLVTSPLYFSQNCGTMDKELGAALYSMAARNVPALARNLILFYPHHSISIFLDLSAKCLLHLQQVLPRAGVIIVCWKLGGFREGDQRLYPSFKGPDIWAKSHLYESYLTTQDQKSVYLRHSPSQFCDKSAYLFHYTMCCLGSLSSSQSNKLRHTLKFVFWYPIQHIFILARSIARNSYKIMFLWISNSKSVIFPKI